MVKKNDAIALVIVLLLVVLAIMGYGIFLLRRSAELEPLSSDGSVELGQGGHVHPRRGGGVHIHAGGRNGGNGHAGRGDGGTIHAGRVYGGTIHVGHR